MFDDMSAVTSVQTANRALQAMIDDDELDQIVLLIDSPGGGVDGIHDFVQRLADCPKPLTAYIDGSGCSAAYWIASACETIYTSATSRIGSIGVVITMQSKAWIADEFGVYYITNAEATDKYPEVASDDGAAKIQTDANAVYRIFRNDVMLHRPSLTEAMINELAGGVRVGQEAVAAGLADAVDDFDAVLARLVTPMEDSMSMPISPTALQSALVGGTPEASDALLNELKQANDLSALRAELEADYTAKLADLSGKLEAVTARLALLEGEAPQGNHWSGGYVASQAATNQPSHDQQYAQPQVGGIDQSFVGWLTSPDAK
jgi:ClpP class serine protease